MRRSPLPTFSQRPTNLRGHKEWLTEVNVLGIVDHPNLVKLIGYCAEDDERGMQRLLIYEFMHNRSVHDHLSTRSTTHIPWFRRLRIALDAARGLTYLHEEMDFQIIFRDFKTSNILLDEHWNAKLSDFGCRDNWIHGAEYIQTGRLTSKSDTWSYGVFLYELITGRQPLDKNRPKNEQKLLAWIKPYISDVKKFGKIVDPRMEADFSLHSGTRLAAVANRCLVRQSKMRPKMSEVLDMVQRIVETRETGAPELPLKSSVLNETIPEEKKKKKGLNLNILEMPMTPKRSGILKSGEVDMWMMMGWILKMKARKSWEQ
ncbi:hypothetical protein J5N97_023194 [Dioscorea zingiberensis]|uniref:Protein kinase domain-containing protein n=1 Tax=Dioscorea zingiberensis TaxID=325984 RepID=A0A9D5CCX3_9LILI|nr:hypothetical protein J5N97_023194 [Dioscorea zingiberensis]